MMIVASPRSMFCPSDANRLAPSTPIDSWISDHRDLTAYARLWQEGRTLFKP
jgi:hypothetical protein